MVHGSDQSFISYTKATVSSIKGGIRHGGRILASLDLFQELAALIPGLNESPDTRQQGLLQKSVHHIS